jgi:UDP-2,3-diacylglucosamine pyrophosphatase LpxH
MLLKDDAPVEFVDTLAISDIHIGSDLCRAEALHRVLKRFRFKRLILGGDIFDHLNLTPAETGPRLRLPETIQDDKPPLRERRRRLKRSQIKLLEYINGLAKERDGREVVEVVWIIGNHDEGLEKLAFLFGADVYQVYSWNFCGKKILAIHGDQFDHFWQNHPVISNVFTKLYGFIQLMFPHAYTFSSFLKRSSKHYIRAIEFIEKGAVDYAKKKGADIVVCGHTHRASQRTIDGIHFFNLGCWTEHDCSLITFSEKERSIKVRQYHVVSKAAISEEIISEISIGEKQ